MWQTVIGAPRGAQFAEMERGSWARDFGPGQEVFGPNYLGLSLGVKLNRRLNVKQIKIKIGNLQAYPIMFLNLI